MKIKIFNLKMKKGFLRIAASLVACASLVVSVAIPSQATKEGIWSKFKNMGKEKVEELQKECQDEINKRIESYLSDDFGQNDSIDIGGYNFTKKRYQHIAYGDYKGGVNSQGLHMNCGLTLLEESLKIFDQTLTDKKEQEWENIKINSQNVLKAYEDIGDGNDADSGLMHCRLIHSNVSHTSRYLFPKNWGFAELKKALKIAIDQKAEFAKTLEKKSDDIAKNKQAIQKNLNNIEKDKKTKKDLNLNDLLKQCVLNDMIYGCEKKQLALKDECFPNLYGYANTNGKSVSLHIIDIDEVEGKGKSGKKILVQLVTDELSKEIVTFFPINVQDLKDGEFRIVPNEGEDDEDDEDDGDDKSNNSPKADSNSPKTNNNSSKTKIYDIFQLDELNGKQFLKRTKFEISDKFKNNKSSLINNGNMNVLRGVLNKIENHLNDDQSKKYFKELDAFVNDKLTNYIKSSKNELESSKKVDTLDESNADASKEKDKKLQKTQLIKKLKSEFEKLGKNTSLPQSSDKTDEKELDEAKTFMLTTILGNVFCINNQINNANTKLKKLKNKKDDSVNLKSDIYGLRKRLANNIELMQRSGIETLLIDGLRKQLESYKKSYEESLEKIGEEKLSKTKTSNETELLNEMLGEIKTLLLNLKNLDKCEVAFTQGGLDLSEEVKNLGSVDKYMGELDQLLNGLIVNDNVFSSVITLMKNKLKDNADREKAKEKAKKEAEKKKEEEKKVEEDGPIDLFD